MDPPVRWLLEFHPDFPGPSRVAPYLRDPIVLAPGPLHAPAWPEVSGPCVAYGTMRTVTRLRRHAPLAHAVFDDYAVLRCSSYYRAVYDLLGRTAVIVPLSALPHLPLARMLGPRVFVRPDSNYKLFRAQVIDADAGGEVARLLYEHHDELVVVSEVVALGPEYRCFVRNGRVFAHSSYADEPYGPAPREVVAFAEQVAARLAAFVTSGMVTVDVAVGADRLRLVEVGGVNSWGIYGASVPDFVAAMEQEARVRWEAGGGA